MFMMTKNKLFYNTSLLSAVAFSEKYKMSVNMVHMAYYYNNPQIKRIDGKLYVDEKALLRRVEFRKRIWNKAHDNYYAITEYISDSQLYNFLSRMFGDSKRGWIQFLAYDLFSMANIEKSILSYKINNKLWVFYRFTTALIRMVLRREKLVEQGKMRRVKAGGVKR